MMSLKGIGVLKLSDIEIAKQNIVKRFPSVMKQDAKKIYIYGSCARGDYDDDSDVDVAILTNCGREEAKKYDEELMDIVTDIAMESDAIVEYICIPYEEYQEKKNWYGYFQNIENEGQLIYG